MRNLHRPRAGHTSLATEAWWARVPIGVLLLGSLGLVQCRPNVALDPGPAIRQVLTSQELAWNRGDIRQFMTGYAADVCFIGSRGRTCGRDAVTLNYEKSYPNKATMGNLRFEVSELLPVGTDYAWVTGTWQIYRATDTVGGGFSLLWRNDAEEWHIIRDHTY